MSEPRRFQAYGVGLPKTGTTSLDGIFSNYRSRHEFMFRETLGALIDREKGKLSPTQFRTFLHQRDQMGAMEMDSTSFAFAYAAILADEFPNARFILTIRDCYSWLDSLLNHALNIGPGIKPFLIAYAQDFVGVPLESSMLASRGELEKNLPKILDGYLRYWSAGNARVLAALPSHRLLVLRTHEISSNLPRLAVFVGVPEETLVAERVHLYKGFSKYPLLASLPPGVLQKSVDAHCRTVMETIFPGYRLADYLQGKEPS